MQIRKWYNLFQFITSKVFKVKMSFKQTSVFYMKVNYVPLFGLSQ